MLPLLVLKRQLLGCIQPTLLLAGLLLSWSCFWGRRTLQPSRVLSMQAGCHTAHKTGHDEHHDSPAP